ncbi:MAG: YihY/virulence factor BrkB family protein [Oscillospiraceae bacterium]|nr:YihY/virulence factor BrkB family protein [Oscillospiraceae bacterium]
MRKLTDFITSCAYAVKRLSKRFEADNLTAYAAQATFFIFISIFPFLMLFLNLIKYIPIFSSENVETWNLDFMSPTIGEMLKSIVAEAGETGSGALISITTIAALWACSKGVLGVIYGLNSIYKTTEKRGYVRLRAVAVFYTIAFIVALIVALTFMVFGNRILDAVLINTPVPASFAEAVRIVRWLVSLGFLVLFFMFIYTVIPERKTKMKNELPGALISAAGWIGFSALYSFYIDNFGNHSSVYGSLTAIVLFMLWLYFCMIILFFGAEINDMIRVHNFYQLIKRSRSIQKSIKAKIRN